MILNKFKICNVGKYFDHNIAFIFSSISQPRLLLPLESPGAMERYQIFCFPLFFFCLRAVVVCYAVLVSDLITQNSLTSSDIRPRLRCLPAMRGTHVGDGTGRAQKPSGSGRVRRGNMSLTGARDWLRLALASCGGSKKKAPCFSTHARTYIQKH